MRYYNKYFHISNNKISNKQIWRNAVMLNLNCKTLFFLKKKMIFDIYLKFKYREIIFNFRFGNLVSISRILFMYR